MMDVKNARFLEALKAALEGGCVAWDTQMQMSEWMDLFKMAQDHHILPMIYEAVYACSAAKKADPQMLAAFKRRTMQSVVLQTMKTEECLSLIRYLKDAGVQPLVVKGIVCRELYPKPDHRMSGDEDVLISPEQYALCQRALSVYGMHQSGLQQDAEKAYEVPYGKPGSPIYIELHRQLFPPESEAYGDLNRFFADVHERQIEISVRGTAVPTMDETSHLFYLICHAFKHFLHSGFGIRQVCDIVLFANRYGSAINWLQVLEQCREIHAEYFTAALFTIGRKYLVFDPEKACYPQEWSEIQVDETAMLADLLGSGVYGDASMGRKHSSSMTLEAVSSSKQGKTVRSGVLKSVFPSAKLLAGRYPYLRRRPYLLPVAWASRLIKYYKETKVLGKNEMSESIRIGKERIELMKDYRIIR